MCDSKTLEEKIAIILEKLEQRRKKNQEREKKK